MKLAFFDEFKLGVVKGDAVVDVSDAVRDIPRLGPQDVINGVIADFGTWKPRLEAAAAAGKGIANCLLLRGPGSVLDELPFCARHTPYTGACVAPTKIIAGLALSLGMRLVVAPGATGDYRSDLAAKAQAAADALAAPGSSAPSFLLCHLKAVDDAGHDRNVQKRVAYTQAADVLLGQLVARLWRHGLTHTVVCVTGDHSTPVLFGDHSTEPVPVAVAHLRDVVAALGGATAMEAWPMGKIYTPEFQPPPGQQQQAGSGVGAGAPVELVSTSAAIAGDAVCRFDELSCARGGLGRFKGGGLMDLLKAFARTQPEMAAPYLKAPRGLSERCLRVFPNPRRAARGQSHTFRCSVLSNLQSLARKPRPAAPRLQLRSFGSLGRAERARRAMQGVCLHWLPQTCFSLHRCARRRSRRRRRFLAAPAACGLFVAGTPRAPRHCGRRLGTPPGPAAVFRGRLCALVAASCGPRGSQLAQG